MVTSDPQLVMSAFLLVDRCHEKDRKWKRKSIITVGKIWLVDFLFIKNLMSQLTLGSSFAICK